MGLITTTVQQNRGKYFPDRELLEKNAAMNFSLDIFFSIY